MKHLGGMLLVLACAGSLGAGAPSPRVEGRLHRGQFAPDTLVVSAAWTAPLDDGKGLVDSLRVRLSGFGPGVDTAVVFAGRPFPVAWTVRRVIPASFYTVGGGSSTFQVYVTIQTWRRASFATAESNRVDITLIDAAPLPVTGLTVTAVKHP